MLDFYRNNYGILDRTLCRCRLEGMIFKQHPNSLFEDGPGPGLERVGGEFRSSFEIVHPGGGARLYFHITFYFRTKGLNSPPFVKGRLGEILKHGRIYQSAPLTYGNIKIYRLAQVIAEMRAHRSRLKDALVPSHT